MAHVRFTIQIDCENPEPDRIIPDIAGEIFDGASEDADEEVGKKIGQLNALLVLRSRAINEGESLFDAMDSLSQSATDCYTAIFEPLTCEWNEAIEQLYDGMILEGDVLYIEAIELDDAYRGKGIGAEVVRGMIATFASSGVSLVACKPFPLQYSNWELDDEEHKAKRAEPGFEEKRIADFARVAKFWTDLGFRKLPGGSDFYTYAPDLLRQPDFPRVPRGRRRRLTRAHILNR